MKSKYNASKALALSILWMQAVIAPPANQRLAVGHLESDRVQSHGTNDLLGQLALTKLCDTANFPIMLDPKFLEGEAANPPVILCKAAKSRLHKDPTEEILTFCMHFGQLLAAGLRVGHKDLTDGSILLNSLLGPESKEIRATMDLCDAAVLSGFVLASDLSNGVALCSHPGLAEAMRNLSNEARLDLMQELQPLQIVLETGTVPTTIEQPVTTQIDRPEPENLDTGDFDRQASFMVTLDPQFRNGEQVDATVILSEACKSWLNAQPQAKAIAWCLNFGQKLFIGCKTFQDGIDQNADKLIASLGSVEARKIRGNLNLFDAAVLAGVLLLSGSIGENNRFGHQALRRALRRIPDSSKPPQSRALELCL